MATGAIAPHDGDSDGEDFQWPPLGSLAKRWDARSIIRDRVRLEHRLLLWPAKASVGVASMPALSLNRFVVADIMLEWCPVSREPKSPPIGWLRREAGSFRAWSFFIQYGLILEFLHM